MRQLLTRRQVLVAGAVLAASGCSRRTDSGLAARPAPRASAAGSATAGATWPGIWYRVEEGDTLSSIARRSGIDVGTIAERNRLRTSLITPGQRLWLPGVRELEPDPLAARREQHRAATVDGSYRLVPRSAWATAAVGANCRSMGRISRLTLHHTGDHAGFRGKSDVEIVQMIDRYHREGRHWSAIGYHYLVGRDGRVYEGRPASIQGAHVSCHNPHNIGISCIGDFQSQLPPAQQLATLERFLEDQRRRYGLGRGRVYAHRDLGQTICPGERLYRWFSDWKRGA